MGSQNQKMVTKVHLNRWGFKGDGIAYFFEPKTPQEEHRTISAVSTRVQSKRSPIVSSEPALPAVKETVCTEPNALQFQLLKDVANFYDNLGANLCVQNSLKRGCLALNVPYPRPRPGVRFTPPQKYFPKFWRSPCLITKMMITISSQI